MHGCWLLTDDDVLEDVGVVVGCSGHRRSEIHVTRQATTPETNNNHHLTIVFHKEVQLLIW